MVVITPSVARPFDSFELKQTKWPSQTYVNSHIYSYSIFETPSAEALRAKNSHSSHVCYQIMYTLIYTMIDLIYFSTKQSKPPSPGLQLLIGTCSEFPKSNPLLFVANKNNINFRDTDDKSTLTRSASPTRRPPSPLCQPNTVVWSPFAAVSLFI